MPSPDSKLKTARMSAATWAAVERQMKLKGITFSQWVKEKSEETQSENEEAMDITARCYGMTLDEMIGHLNEGLDDGSIVWENGKFTCWDTDVDLVKFKEACDKKGVPYQKIIDRSTRSVLRSLCRFEWKDGEFISTEKK